jgi:hypothetical protein
VAPLGTAVATVIAVRFAAWLMLVPSAVFADEPPPSFVTLDRADWISRAGVEASYVWPSTASGSVLRFDPYVQAVDPGTGIGGYAALPISEASSATAFGGLEVGGIYATHLWNAAYDLVVHLGLALPTGATDVAGSTANAIATSSRFADDVLALPDTTLLRFGLSPIWRQGRWFARGDLGFDFELPTEHGKPLRLNAAVGVDLDTVVLSVESVNLVDFRGSPMNELGTYSEVHETWFDTAAIAARFRFDHLEPYAAVVLPLDNDSRAIFDVALTVGLAIR